MSHSLRSTVLQRCTFEEASPGGWGGVETIREGCRVVTSCRRGIGFGGGANAAVDHGGGDRCEDGSAGDDEEQGGAESDQ